jgi:vacuolar-type H+-ATPase subunit H
LPQNQNTESPYPEGSILARIGQEEERLMVDVEKAQEKAGEILASAEREAEKILEEARASLPQLEQELLIKAEPEMQRKRDEILAESERRSSEMVSRARSNLDTAVSAIVEGVLPVKEKNPQE